MKKIIFMCMMLVASVCNAQHVVEAGALDNTYVNVSVGGIVPTNDVQWNTIRPQFGIEIGKDITTLYTTGFEFKTSVNTTGVKTAFDEFSVVWLHKFNLTNAIYNRTRKFEILSYVGLGWGHEMVVRDNYAVFDAGIEVVYNLNNTWALTLKPHIEWCHANNGFNVNHSDLGLSVGITYNFPNRDGSRGYRICDRDKYYNEYVRLNDEVNNLRRQLEECNNRPPVVKEVVKETKTIITKPEYLSNPVVFFAQNSAELTDEAKTILDDIHVKTVGVHGYASPEGSDEYNQKLSEQRANVVAEYLTNKGIKICEIKGFGAQSNSSNRVAIVIVK